MFGGELSPIVWLSWRLRNWWFYSSKDHIKRILILTI